MFIQSRLLIYDSRLWHMPNRGIVNFTPLGLLYIKYLESEISDLLRSHGYSQLSVSSISNIGLWVESGRYDKWIDDLFVMDNVMFLPTAEEQVVNLVGSIMGNRSRFPIKVFQHNSKYRYEKRPQNNLYRTFEFLMLDAYSFHSTQLCSYSSYFNLRRAFKSYLSRYFDVKIERALGKEMGKNVVLSEEFLIEREGRKIELAHIFCLGDTYTYKSKSLMNCYGIGTQRLLNEICETGNLGLLRLFSCAVILNDKVRKIPSSFARESSLIFDSRDQSISDKINTAKALGIEAIFLYDKGKWYEILDNVRRDVLFTKLH